MTRSRNVTVGLMLFALLGVLDVVGVLGAGMEDAPPLPLVIAGFLLGVVTLAGVRMAWRGAPRGMAIAVVSRILSALIGVPVFLVDDAPRWAKVTVAVCIGVTAMAVGLVSSTRRTVVQGAA